MFGMTTRIVAMFRHISFFFISTFCLLYIGCVSSNKSKFSQSFKNKNYVNPTNIQVDWKNLYDENQSSEIRSFLTYSKETKMELTQDEIPYAVNGIHESWNNRYLKANNKYDHMRKYGVDCTRFLWHLYSEKMKLPFNASHKNAPILSQTFARSHSSKELKYFVPIKKQNGAFTPRTGDILAFPGHALAVLDPKKCIAIQSASWVCRKMSYQGYCLDAAKGKDAGVTIYKLMNKGDCEEGVWKQLDAPKNRFTAGWRHKALNTWIEELPTEALPQTTIKLIGYNIANRYIYFQGAKHAQKTSHSIATTTNKNGYKLDIVKVKVPHDAQTGKLKIYWGNHSKPNHGHTINSIQTLKIQKEKYLSINH